MLATARVQSRGQVTLPQAVREAAGVRPGDLLTVEVVERGVLRVRVLPSLSIDDLIARFGLIDEAVDIEADRDQWTDSASPDLWPE